MDYLPVAQDIEPYAAELAVNKNTSEIALRLGIAKEKLERLIAHNPEAIEKLAAARAEYEAFLRMRALLMGPEALDTVEQAMRGQIDEKKVSAALRAAEGILDRTVMPKIRQQVHTERPIETNRILPDLNELIEGAEDEAEAHQIADRYRSLFSQIDAFRRGAKEVIEGEVSE